MELIVKLIAFLPIAGIGIFAVWVLPGTPDPYANETDDEWADRQW